MVYHGRAQLQVDKVYVFPHFGPIKDDQFRYDGASDCLVLAEDAQSDFIRNATMTRGGNGGGGGSSWGRIATEPLPLGGGGRSGGGGGGGAAAGAGMSSSPTGAAGAAAGETVAEREARVRAVRLARLGQ